MGWFGKRRSSARRKARGSRPPKSPYPERTGWMMEDGWGAVTFEMDDRDYFMKELESADRFAERHASYQRSTLWLRYVVHTMCSRPQPQMILNEATFDTFLQLIKCRVTLLAAAAQAQEPDKEIGLQANWKDPKRPSASQRGFRWSGPDRLQDPRRILA